MEQASKLDRLAAEHAKLRAEESQNDVMQDIMLEHQQPIPEDNIILECDHTPELLLPTDTSEHSDHIKVMYQCQACGEELEDIRPLDESDMA